MSESRYQRNKSVKRKMTEKIMDEMYLLSGKDLEETYENLKRDLNSITVRANEGVYFYPCVTGYEAIVSLDYKKHPQESIGLQIAPAVDDEISLKELKDVIKKYNFELLVSQEAKSTIFIIPTDKSVNE